MIIRENGKYIVKSSMTGKVYAECDTMEEARMKEKEMKGMMKDKEKKVM